jgi:hypothetical protein
MALAPMRPLFSVPSSSIIARSMSRWSSASRPSRASADFVVDGIDRLGHALAQVTALVAIAQFDGFVRAGRGTRRHGRTAERTIVENVDFDGGIAPAVENFAGVNIDDRGHDRLPLGFRVTGQDSPLPAANDGQRTTASFSGLHRPAGSYRLEPCQASGVGLQEAESDK